MPRKVVPFRLTVVLTHPVQYMSPWFRYMAQHAPDIDLTVLYAVIPAATHQAVGFGSAFTWDVPLLDGYRSHAMRKPLPTDCLRSNALAGIDARGIGRAIAEVAPDAVIVPGWHSLFYWRAIAACRARRFPVLYRGDSTLVPETRMHRRAARGLRTRAFLQSFDGYLSVGRRARQFLTHYGAREYQVFDSPHCVDNEFFAAAAAPYRTATARAAARARFGAAPDETVVLLVGKLTENKRPLDALRAAADAGARLLVVGDGALKPAMAAEADRLGARVSFAGFLNQSQLGAAYAAADCLALPSARETWGLVANEALASGVPIIVSDGCGCGPDLVVPGDTGYRVPTGDLAALSLAIQRVRERLAQGHDFAAAARTHVARYSFEAATAGVVNLCRLVARRGVAEPRGDTTQRVLAPCGDMVIAGGLERMTFEALAAIGDSGGQVHCIVNSWENHRIVPLAEEAGATWSRGLYFYAIRRRFRSPLGFVQMLWDIARTSSGLLTAAMRFRPTHVLIPEYVTAIRNAPALLVLRAAGTGVVLRLGNAPEPTAFYRLLWRWAISPLVDRFVCNSKFTERELLAHGIPAEKVSHIYNTVPRRHDAAAADDHARGRIVYVGQVIPEKGVLELLEAVALLLASGLDARLDVVGDMSGWLAPRYAQYRDIVRARAESEDLEGRVRFLGWREDVPSVLAAAAVHCCPSRPEQREGFGVVNLEAKMAAVPSVVTPVGALPELVRHRIDGWVCRDASAGAIAEGLAYFLDDPLRAAEAGEAARRSAARFDRQRFARAWVEVFST